MFSGVGGFEVGIEEAFGHMGIEPTNPESRQAESGIQFGGKCPIVEEERGICPHELGGRGPICIGYSEIDRYACSIYRRHFPEHKNFGDATRLNPRDLPDFDLLVGGFPCQAFSIAGKRAGFMDARGTLFFEIARVLEHKRPRYFLLENVEGLLSHDDRKTIVAIIRVLADLGYRVSWQVLNTKDYGLPQNRERIFIAGHSRGERGPEVFPIAETGICNFTGGGLMEITQGQSQGFRVYDPSGLATSIASQAGGLGAKTGLYALKNTSIRRLTPRECCRLQGFPGDWCDWGIDDKGNKITISDTQKYRCLGNAVSTNVIARIISGWKELAS